MEAIAAAIDAGQQALVLLPEIALTEPMLTRFAARFGCAPVAWHPGLRSTERRRAWPSTAAGAAKLGVGAQPAPFLPSDRKSGGEGTGWSGRLILGGGR